MPEGPSIVMYRKELSAWKGLRVTHAEGTTKTIDPKELIGRKLTALNSFGKYLLLGFGKGLNMSIHFGMFGTIRPDDKKEAAKRLHLLFENDSYLNFYTTSLRFITQPLDEVYDWSADIMNAAWDDDKALKKLKAQSKGRMICDILLDQTIFAGLGNIIKNEILFQMHTQPESVAGSIPPKKLKELIRAAVDYAQDFLRWKQEGTLRSHWKAHNQKVCPRDNIPFIKAHTGEGQRRSFWCEQCMKKYG